LARFDLDFATFRDVKLLFYSDYRIEGLCDFCLRP
jgi:hypothetical protein